MLFVRVTNERGVSCGRVRLALVKVGGDAVSDSGECPTVVASPKASPVAKRPAGSRGAPAVEASPKAAPKASVRKRPVSSTGVKTPSPRKAHRPFPIGSDLPDSPEW